MSLKNRSFLKLLDYTPAEIEELLDLAADLKAKKKAGVRHDALRGKNIALIFEKTSTRTRCSFEVAAHDLGMEVTYLDPSGSQIGKKESIADTARVLGRMFDGIEYRGYGQQIVEDLARYAGVPVWNGLTNEFHPTQILADFLADCRNDTDSSGLVVDNTDCCFICDDGRNGFCGGVARNGNHIQPDRANTSHGLQLFQSQRATLHGINHTLVFTHRNKGSAQPSHV